MKRPYREEKAWEAIRSAAAVTGSFDHRVVNGAEGAAFLEKVKELFEKEFK